jgi:hypothetical protein
VERGGKVRTWAVPRATREHIIPKILANVSIEADVYTDEAKIYIRFPKPRGTPKTGQ